MIFKISILPVIRSACDKYLPSSHSHGGNFAAQLLTHIVGFGTGLDKPGTKPSGLPSIHPVRIDGLEAQLLNESFAHVVHVSRFAIVLRKVLLGVFRRQIQPLFE